MKMNEYRYRKSAAIVGGLFILATAVSIVSLFVLGSALDGPNFILTLSDIENNVRIAAALEAVLAISLIGIGAILFPILREQVDNLGMAYAVLRLVEGVLIIASTVCLLVMLSLGQDYANGLLDESSARSLGMLLVSLREWFLLFGTLIFLGLGGLVLNYVLYRSMLVPRWLSAWGIIGAICILLYGAIGLFGVDTSALDATSLLALPVATQEMVLAAWLIFKGFSTTENTAGTPVTA
jgi:hypothetical protein